MIYVHIDDRLRLMAAVLALTDFPEREQAYYPHGVHPHAKMTRYVLAGMVDHEAVHVCQQLLDQGTPLRTLFQRAAALDTPHRTAPLSLLGPALISFAAHSQVNALWQDAAADWEAALSEAKQALSHGDPMALLRRFFGPLDIMAIFQPNLCYPSLEAVGIRAEGRAYTLCPPRLAWGDSPPWPYNDDPAATQQDMFSTLARLLITDYLSLHADKVKSLERSTNLPVPPTFAAMNPNWVDQFAILFSSGLTAIYLEHTFSPSESSAYVLMQHKHYQFDVLPSVIGALKHYLQNYESGKYSEFIDYITAFCLSLLVTERFRHI